MKKFLKKLRHRIVLYVFDYYFGNFVYSFEDADAKVRSLNPIEQNQYAEDITNWIQTMAFKIENQGQLMDVYKEMAEKGLTEDVFTAYRLQMLKIKNQEIRLQSKAEKHKQLQILQNRNRSIK